MAGQKTERECAMEAERLGNKLKSAMNSGKSHLVKILKVRGSVEHRTRAPHRPTPRGNLAAQRLNLNLESTSPLRQQDISDALSRVGQGEDGGEIKVATEEAHHRHLAQAQGEGGAPLRRALPQRRPAHLRPEDHVSRTTSFSRVSTSRSWTPSRT